MEKIYSKISPDILLHIINRKEDIIKERNDLAPQKEYLQVACFEMDKGKTFKPHKHIKQERLIEITQESWVVIEGAVKATLYDLDDSIIKEIILKPGDCSITFYGGHNYEAIEDRTIIYEYKTGPYQGVEKDKARF